MNNIEPIQCKKCGGALRIHRGDSYAEVHRASIGDFIVIDSQGETIYYEDLQGCVDYANEYLEGLK